MSDGAARHSAEIMKHTLSLAFVSALLLPLAVGAQSSTPVPQQQQVKPHAVQIVSNG